MDTLPHRFTPYTTHCTLHCTPYCPATAAPTATARTARHTSSRKRILPHYTHTRHHTAHARTAHHPSSLNAARNGTGLPRAALGVWRLPHALLRTRARQLTLYHTALTSTFLAHCCPLVRHALYAPRCAARNRIYRVAARTINIPPPTIILRNGAGRFLDVICPTYLAPVLNNRCSAFRADLRAST